MHLNGNAHVYGDDIDTDRIIPGKYTKTLNLNDLADHVLEDLDPDFRSRLQSGDILVGGSNFGCGSSREQAPLALKAAGVSVVIAKSFARIFYRNAINIGLPLVEIPHHEINSQDEISVDLESGRVVNETASKEYVGTKMPEVMISILNAGGLASYLKTNKNYSI
ncbi:MULTISPECIES: 3-isopropylmalate dehydratase small subunit [Cytobacillus]|uniref:3-isopropylmalate dehydratase small subunit n=1 Tax=Cytobacillus TaxID=2675230 RepID=UPI002041B9C4|nr:3-isopropylmalate dehydratase small subunit [Cytobacillus firmus]MCM3708451.1 3-isopropylmalate dehydratase small subunit [Cytobacillus firmus]